MRFSDVVGQEQLKNQLRSRVQTGMVPHASLFLGSEGSGNFALAMAFAQYACCDHRDERDACGNCDVCRKFETLQYADLHFTYPVFKRPEPAKGLSTEFNAEWRSFIAGEAYPTLSAWNERLDAEKKQLMIFVAEAGAIAQRLALRSYEGRYIIQVIWLPELMREDTANKLLKLIEEPPAQTLFLMISQSADRILPTILSRTQLVKVPAIEDEAVAQSLVEKEGLTLEAAQDVARFVEGDYARARAIARDADGQAAFLGKFASWMRACYARDAAQLVDFASEIGAGSREMQKRFLSYTLHFFRQCIVNNYGENDLARFTRDEQAFASRFAPFINHKNVMSMSDLINDAIRDVDGNANGKLVFLDLSLKLHSELRR